MDLKPKSDINQPYQPRFLRQLKSGHIYTWTEALAAKKDMVPFDAETAKRRIAALKQMKAAARKKNADPEEQARIAIEMKEAKALAEELTELENQVDGLAEASAAEDKTVKDAKTPPPKAQKSEAEIEAARRNDIIAKDSHINKVMSMKKKSDVEAYLLTEYGEEISPDETLANMKNVAINLRTERLFEGDKG